MKKVKGQIKKCCGSKQQPHVSLSPEETQQIFDLAASMTEYPPTPDSGNASSYQEGGEHYQRMKIQPWDVVDTWPLQQRIGAYRFSAVKYLMRLGEKDDILVEAKKARQCCHKLQDTIEIGETTGE